MGLDIRAARSVDNGASLGLLRSEVLIGPTSVDGGLGHSFRILGFLLFFHDDPPCLDAMQDLFTIRLPGGIVRRVQEGDGSERMLEDLLVGGVGRRHAGRFQWGTDGVFIGLQ